MGFSEYLPNGKKRRRIPLEEILIIEEPIFKIIEEALDRKFTAEQEKTVKALLFFLKRENFLKKENIELREIGDKIEIRFMNNELIGYSSIKNESLFTIPMFSYKEDLIKKGIGIMIYTKLIIIASLQGVNIGSESRYDSSATNVWKRFEEVGLSYIHKKRKNNDDFYKFVDLSFLSKKDFAVIDKILNK